MENKPDYVTRPEPSVAPDQSGVRPLTVDRIKQALLTSRLTLAGHSTGADPYNTRGDRRRQSVWGNRDR